MTNKYVLSIAGSDPSGGAGIQADLKTFTTLGVYGSAVITSLTVQNSEGIKEIVYLDPDFVKEQIKAVLEDIEISFIKTGMMGNSMIAKAAGELVDGKFLICDPVFYSKTGKKLFDNDYIDIFENYIVSQCLVLTPNYNELLILSGNRENDPVKAGEIVLNKFDRLKAIVIKGGHINADSEFSIDILLLKSGMSIDRRDFSHPRIRTENTHGTGCTFSSALTAYLALGESIEISAQKASEYVHRLIKLASINKIGRGNGPLPHFLLCRDNKEDV